MIGKTLTLSALKGYRMAAGLTADDMADLTGIDRERFKKLESLSKGALEPWLSEAATCARILAVKMGACAILPLTGATAIDDLPLGFDARGDLNTWRTGVPLPLSTAFRLTRYFGLPDPILLFEMPRLYQQVWDVIATGERTGAPAICPWCVQPDGEHLHTCLPNNLWHARNLDVTSTIGTGPKPRDHRRTLEYSNMAPGLKAIRLRLDMTQAEFAQMVGMASNQYAQIERCERPLTSRYAERFTTVLRTDPSVFYAAPAVGSSDIEGDA